MKFSLPAGEFLSVLRMVQARTKNNANFPILNHIRVDADGDAVTVLGHDMDSCSEAKIAADVLQSGAYALPAEPLVRLVTGMPSGASVAVEVDGLFAAVKCGRSRYKLPVLLVDIFPQRLEPRDGKTFKITKADIEQLFVRPAAMLDPKDTRPVYSGVYVHDDEGALCSGGYSTANLVRFSTDVPADGFSGVIVPRAAVDEIGKIGAGELTLASNVLRISSGSRSYCSKLIDGKYPEQYRSVIPEIGGSFFDVDSEEFSECLSRLAVISDFADERLMDVVVGEDEISASIVGAGDGTETIECDVSGAAGKSFCMPVRQLLGACQMMRGEKLRFYLRRTMDPVRIVDPGESSAINVQTVCISKNRRAEAA
ncbi:DNA polymerase III subunit beta [Bradyrhizobium prioriisuperbiae]|uniref:DNA polymerase III subunit beta n=1 Tax=Bradyrhizobium prioriisuperbiae TaxID=2854389 RepID=UPI0028EE0E84|nr:DNA polymerase III subunit beta [Bradyrhizobium prioritasuperba]